MPQKQRNIQGRAHTLHVDFVDRAARSLGKTQSVYVAETMLQQAAHDLREPIPVLPTELVDAAAERLGMSRREYERHAAAELAARTQASGSIAPPRSRNRTPRSPVGGVPIAGFEATAPRGSRARTRAK